MSLVQPKGLPDRYINTIMDVRSSRNSAPSRNRSIPLAVERKKLEYCRSFSQGHGSKRSRYFTFESLFLLVCLTALLLILPLILPPLPPPPFMLLMIPICIFVLLMILAFMPANVRDTRTYV